MDLLKFRKLIDTYFNEEELRTLCFDLKIDFDSLPARGKGGKARELVSYCERNDILGDLLKECQQARPQVDWANEIQFIEFETDNIQTGKYQTYLDLLKRDLGLDLPDDAPFSSRLNDPTAIFMPIPYETPDAELYDDLWPLLATDNSGVLLLTGDYGTGKSFIVRKLMANSTNRLPIFYPLKRFRSVRDDSILDELLDELSRYGLREMGRLELEKLIQAGRIIVILDGFDEIPLLAFANVERRIRQLIDPLNISTNRVVITSRPGILPAKILADIFHVRLRGWNMATWKAYLKACQNIGWHHPGGYEVYYEIVANEPSLSELTSVPLYCQMLVETSDRIEPPLNLAALYQTYVTIYLDREVERSVIQDPQIKQDLLIATAQGMLADNQIYFTVPELEQALRKHAQHVPKQFVDSFIATHDMTVHSLLVFDRKMRLSFSHKSLYEFFNALGLRRILEDGNLEYLGEGLIPFEILDFLVKMINDDLLDSLLHLLNENVLHSSRNVALVCLLAKGELSYAHLPRLDLRAISLNGRELGIIDSNLTRCDFVGANLAGINLKGSNLLQGKLQGCNLDGADLRYTDLSFATLREISCINTRFEGAKLDGVQIGDKDFSRLMAAIHSEYVNHSSNSDWLSYAETMLRKAAGR